MRLIGLYPWLKRCGQWALPHKQRKYHVRQGRRKCNRQKECSSCIAGFLFYVLCSFDDQIWSKISGYLKQFVEFVLKDLRLCANQFQYSSRLVNVTQGDWFLNLGCPLGKIFLAIYPDLLVSILLILKPLR